MRRNSRCVYARRTSAQIWRGGGAFFCCESRAFRIFRHIKALNYRLFPLSILGKNCSLRSMQPIKKKGGAFTTHCFPYLWGKTEIMVVVFRVDKRSIGAVKQRKGRMQLYQRHLSYAFAIEGIPFCSNRIEMAKGGCSKEQPPFLTNETEKGRGVICSRP